MAINTVVNGEVQTTSMYALAVFISVCVAGFSLANSDDNSAPNANKTLGLMLISGSVITGSLGSTTQKSVFSKFPNFTSTQMMLVCGVFTCALSIIGVCSTTGFSPLMVFLEKNPTCIKDIFALGLSGTMGYFFIFYIVSHHGPVALAIMMVVKQVVSIIFSSLLYGHPLNTMAQLCAIGTFSGVLATTYLSARKAKQDAVLKEEIMKKKSSIRNMLRVTSSLREITKES
jgi:drug/metabolite transporter (DMT)-like permease